MKRSIWLAAGAALAMGAAPVLAQAPARPDMAAQASNGGEGLRGYVQAEQRLLEAMQGLEGAGAGQAGVTRAREAVVAYQQSLTAVPDSLRSGQNYQRLVREVTEANALFTNGRADAAQARREIEQVLATASLFRADAGLSGAQPGTAATNQTGGATTGDPAAASGGLQQRSLQGQAPAMADAQTGASSAPAAAGAAGGQASLGQAAVAGLAAGGAGLTAARAREMIGTNLVNAEGQRSGEIEDLLLDRTGQVRAAIVEWGGFLGIGARRAAVPIERIRMDGQGGQARLDMTRQQLEQLGEFDRDNFGPQAQRQGWGEGTRLLRDMR